MGRGDHSGGCESFWSHQHMLDGMVSEPKDPAGEAEAFVQASLDAVAWGTCIILGCDDSAISANETTPALDDSSCAGFIGFVGDATRGSLTVCADLEVVRATRPGALVQVDASPREWWAEFCNRVLGYAITRLAINGYPLCLTSPTVVVGTDLHFRPVERPRWKRVRADVGDVYVSVDIRVLENFVGGPMQTDKRFSLSPGGALLFDADDGEME